MSKHNRAAKLIRFGIKRGYTPDQIATLLEKFDLLAEDLPAPARDMNNLEWQKEYKQDWDDTNVPTVWAATAFYSVGVSYGDPDITIWHKGHPLEPFTIDEAKALRLALHAAENYAEIYAENQE